MITRFNNRTVIIRRLRTSSGNKKSYIATATAEGSIQNIEDENFASKEGIGKKSYKGYFSLDENINVNDKLVDETTGDAYRVMAVEKLGDELGISIEHLEVILHKFEA